MRWNRVRSSRMALVAGKNTRLQLKTTWSFGNSWTPKASRDFRLAVVKFQRLYFQLKHSFKFRIRMKNSFFRGNGTILYRYLNVNWLITALVHGTLILANKLHRGKIILQDCNFLWIYSASSNHSIFSNQRWAERFNQGDFETKTDTDSIIFRSSLRVKASTDFYFVVF